jgi:dTDP-4-amino-4,6-dideoxygalactose transaminase
MKVQFLNLKIQNDLLKNEIEKEILSVIEASAFAGGPYVEKFEEDFAKYCQTKHAIGVGNGTDALWTALLALGIGPGDEVITTPNSFIATAEAISFCGAKPVFIDVVDGTFTMDCNMLEKAITSKTKAIIPVHIFGQICDMDPILAIGRKHNIPVIEDACQAHGAEYKGKRAGSIGIAGAFSFYPGKNLGAFGEAGAVVTNDDKLSSYIKMFRDHGQSKKYYHDIVGWNARMDGIQGAVLKVKLKVLDQGNEERRRIAGMYQNLLSGINELTLPVEASYGKHIYHLYAVRVKERDQFMNFLKDNDVGCAIHYPVPIHLQKAYSDMGLKKGSLPVSEKSSEEFVSLPMYPGLTDEEVRYTAETVKKYFSKK